MAGAIVQGQNDKTDMGKFNKVGTKGYIFVLKLLCHDLGVAYRGSSLVCYSVTYVEYKSACRVVYAIQLSHISDIRELTICLALLIIDQ